MIATVPAHITSPTATLSAAGMCIAIHALNAEESVSITGVMSVSTVNKKRDDDTGETNADTGNTGTNERAAAKQSHLHRTEACYRVGVPKMVHMSVRSKSPGQGCFKKLKTRSESLLPWARRT